MLEARRSTFPSAEVLRYIVNGVVATGVHYAMLRFGLEVVGIPSAGVANLLAACCGIVVSFVGSRYYVFRQHDEPWLHQAKRFGALYAAIALVHAGLLYVWSDRLHLDYTIGFCIALVIQVISSYFGNKFLVFKA